MKRAKIRKRPYTYKGKTRDRWVVTWTDAKGKRHEKWQPNARFAEAHARKVDREIDEGVHVADLGTVTFAKAAEAYMARLDQRYYSRNRDITGSTRAQYLCMLRKHVVPRFGRLKLTKLRSVDVQRWIDELGETYSRNYLDVLYILVKEVLKYAVEQEWLVRNPLKDKPVKRPGKLKKRADVPTPEDVRRLFAYLFGPRPAGKARYVWQNLKVACALAAFAGLRAGECRALRWEHVDFDRDDLHIEASESWYDGIKGTKSDAGVRTIPSHPILKSILKDHAAFWSSPEVFSGRWTNQRRHQRHLRTLDRSSTKGFVLRHPDGRATGWGLSKEHFHQAMLEAGLVKDGRPKFTFHALRHFAASTWLASGMRPDAVKVHIGHAKIQTTIDTYGHLLPDDQHARAVIQRLVGMFPGLPAAPIELREVDLVMPAAPMIAPPEQVPVCAAELMEVGDQVVDLDGNVLDLALPDTAPRDLHEAMELLVGGWSAQDTCAHIGRHPASIATLFRRFGKPRPIEIVRAVREARFAKLADAGFLDNDIAAKCGVDPKTVWTWRALRENRGHGKPLISQRKSRSRVRVDAEKGREK